MKIKRSVITPALLVSVMLLTACGGGGNSSIPVIHLTGSWAATGNLTSARKDHTATLLPNGKVLVVAGDNLVSAELYDPSTGNWTATGSLATERFNHTATLLSNGKVLVAGGSNAINSYIPDAELYDPSTGSWTTTGSLATGRHSHTATLLPNGKVLVTGGFGSGGQQSSSELYDPSTGNWATTGSLTTGRFNHTATLLPNGSVLVSGGASIVGASWNSIASAELYDPATLSWTATGNLSSDRYSHTATLLPNGKVLVAGGRGGGNFRNIAELYDSSTGNWTTTGSLATGRNVNTATLLPNGKVLVAGGFGETTPPSQITALLASAELYDPSTGSWAETGSLTIARGYHTATLLPNGKVLVVGGSDLAYTALASTELYW